MGQNGIQCQDSVTLEMNLEVQLIGNKILIILSPTKAVKVSDPLQIFLDLLFVFLKL